MQYNAISKDDVSTISEMLIDGVHECFILEPTDRGTDNANHVEGKTAIYPGDYKITIDQSQRFGRLMPHILAITDYPFGPATLNTAGVRLHWGNYPKDTEACSLCGSTEGKDFVGNSVAEFNPLFAKFQAAIAAGQEIDLNINRNLPSA